MTEVHMPPNELLRIDEIYLFVSVDEGGEGVVAAPLNGTLMPLIAADKARLDSLVPLARRVAKRSGRLIKLVKFTTRTEMMVITPDGTPQQ